MNLHQTFHTYEMLARQPTEVSTPALRQAVHSALIIMTTASIAYGRVPSSLRPKNALAHKAKWTLELRLALRDGTRRELAITLDNFWHLVHSGELEPTPFDPEISEKLDRLSE